MFGWLLGHLALGYYGPAIQWLQHAAAVVVTTVQTGFQIMNQH